MVTEKYSRKDKHWQSNKINQSYSTEAKVNKTHYISIDYDSIEKEQLKSEINVGDIFISDRNMVHRGSDNISDKLSYVGVSRVFDFSHDLTISSNPSERP